MNKKLKEIIAETLNLSESDVSESLGPDTCEAWDSLAQVIMISRVTDELGVTIPFEKMMEISSAKDLSDLVGE